jgi:hypothetical protein
VRSPFQKIGEGENCSACKFYVDGCCKRNAPTIHPKTDNIPQWPHVSWSQWCGEWWAVKSEQLGSAT